MSEGLIERLATFTAEEAPAGDMPHDSLHDSTAGFLMDAGGNRGPVRPDTGHAVPRAAAELARVRRKLEEAVRSSRKELTHEALNEAVTVLSRALPLEVAASTGGETGRTAVPVPEARKSAETLENILAQLRSAASRQPVN